MGEDDKYRYHLCIKRYYFYMQLIEGHLTFDEYSELMHSFWDTGTPLPQATD